MVTRKALQILFTFIFISMLGCSAPSERISSNVASSGFACPEPNPRMTFESTSLNLLTWTEYLPADIIECFALVYDVEVNAEYFSSNEELYSKVAVVDGTIVYDVIHPSDYMIGVLMREELLQPLDVSKLPNLVNLNLDLISVYGDSLDYLVPYQMGTQGIVYNSETVLDVPTAWEDLWNPEYENRIVAVDDSRVLIGAALLTLGYDVNAIEETQLAEARQKILELMPNIHVFDSDSPKDFLLSGDVDLGIMWNGEAFLTQQENPAFQYIFPEEGSIIFYDGMGISANAMHSDIAYAWFNYSLQGDVNWLTLVDYPYTNPNQAALNYAKENVSDVYDAYIDSDITNTPIEEFLRGHEVLDLGFGLILYNDIWAEVNP